MITFKLLDGIGVNVRYAIYRDGKHVASMRRTSNRSRFGIYSVHYSEKLGDYTNIDRARAAAHEIEYPDAWQVYETICQRVEGQRRHFFRVSNANELADAARDLANGSNSAQERLITISNKIEAAAKNRSKVTASYLDPETNGWVHSSEPTYPHRPDAKEDAA